MNHADRIRKVGFKRWYEGQLIQAHLYLVSCFLSLIVLGAAIEAYGVAAPAAEKMGMLSIAVLATLGCVFTWQRFQRAMRRTVRFGERAACPSCDTYARFDILASHTPGSRHEGGGDVANLEGTWFKVQCRKCEHTWLID